jgi:hypothetical protein
MKIDIRDEITTDRTGTDEITFATKRICCAGRNQTVNTNPRSSIIDCVDTDTDSIIVRNSDIPNLIKALQKVCELKGIEL